MHVVLAGAAPVAAPLSGPVSMSLPFDVTSARTVRKALGSWLEHQGAGPYVVHDARLVATELVANAVRHASPLANGKLLVRWRLDEGRLLLTVCDGGSGTVPEVVIAAEEDQHGRGLAIVESLTSRWWVERRPWLRAVHAFVALV
ncbi:MAG: histidine kinase, gyrase and HSP90-like ATPase family protein [Marmoricola sp.]|nr:histidine kinase, gyrase and HSP90-like ATPase family protein [Marmoricola sp.]